MKNNYGMMLATYVALAFLLVVMGISELPAQKLTYANETANSDRCDKPTLAAASKTNTPISSVTPFETQELDTEEATVEPHDGSSTSQDDTSCEELKGTITALQQTISVMEGTLNVLSISSPPSLTPTSTDTATSTPTDTYTATETFTPTLTYTPSLTPTITSTPTLDPNALLGEEFTENINEWELADGIALQDGELSIMGVDEIKLVKIPVNALSEFYVEFDARILDDSTMNTNIVFAFGNLEPDQPYNYITFNKDFVDAYQVVDGRSRFISSIQNPIESFATLQRVGISYREGQLEVYLNGSIVMITQVTNEGDQIGLGGQFGESASENAIYFDYLEVFPSRN